MNRLMASERCRLGYRSDTSEIDGAMPPASPTATAMRASSSCQNCVAMPQAIVARLHMVQQAATMLRRTPRSARRPTGMPRPAYNTPKASPVSRPICVSEAPYSRLIGSISTAIACRSM
jgi:hypothetical protein